jgi:cobalt/nickel transport system permease protein
VARLEAAAPQTRGRRLSAGVAAYIAAFAAFSCLAADEAGYSLFITALMGTLGVRAASLKRYAGLCAAPLGFIAAGVLAVALTIGSDPPDLLSVRFLGRYLGFSGESLMSALRLFLKSLGCVASLYFLYLTAPVSAILGLCCKSPLPKVLVELMSLTYRFIFDLTAIGEEMENAQKARLSNLTLRSAVRGKGVLFSSVFIRAYKRSSDTYNAMEARCYQGVMPYIPRSGSGKERAAACAATAGMAALIALIKTNLIPWRL